MAITVSNPPFSAAVFQMVYGAQPQLVGASPSYYDFVAGNTTGLLPTGVTATRASTGYYNNSAGTLASAAVDAPRFTYRHNGTSWAADGMLIEGSATNLVLYSEEFDNAVWTKFNSSASANATTAPDGAATADAIIENSAVTTTHGIVRSVTYLNATTYVHSVFAKAGTRTWIAIYTEPARFGGAGYTYFNLSTGAVGTVSAGSTAVITLEANGFYRCSVISTTTSAGTSNYALSLATGNNGVTYSGDGASLVYMWGANVVAGDVVTSYIKTTSATVTRASDEVVITNANVLADQAWVVKARAPSKMSGGAVNVAMQVDDGSSNNRRTIRDGTDNKMHSIATVGGTDQCDLDMSAITNGAYFAQATRWATNNFAASRDGGAIVTDLSGSNPLGLTTARVGRSFTGNYWNSTVLTIQTLSTATDAELPLLAA